MPIAHSECLYYPDMVVDDVSPDILARLVVCWENIWTIVPEGMTRPSKSRADRELEDLGVLKSFPIAPYSKAVRLAGEAVQKAFDHGSLKKILSDPRENYLKLYDAKLGDQIRSALNWGKLPSEFADCVAGSANTKYWKVSQKFASAYMAVLAKYVADQANFAATTDQQSQFDLSDIATLGRPAPPGDLSRNELLEDCDHASCGEYLLHQFLLRDLQIDPSTPLSKLVRFRERYPAEVARYRSALQAPASNPELLQALVHNDEGRLRDWYKIEVDMPLCEIRDALRGIGVNCIIEQALKISALSTPASGLAIAAGAPPVAALGGQVVLSLASSFFKVREDRKKVFLGKPYAYLYRLQRKFGRQN